MDSKDTLDHRRSSVLNSSASKSISSNSLGSNVSVGPGARQFEGMRRPFGKEKGQIRNNNGYL